jgi:PKD repeat protein
LIYTWDFGDGSPASSEENPAHEYQHSGLAPITRTVTLHVDDERGGTDTAQAEVTILP